MEILAELQQKLPPAALEILRLSIWLLVLMIVFVPLEMLFGAPHQKILRKGVLPDLFYYFLNGLVPQAILVLPTAVIGWSLGRIVPVAIHSWASGLPLGERLAAALVVGEVGFYWGHRWSHEIPLLWRMHAIHHAPAEIDWMVNSHAHPLDIVFVRLCGFIPMYALGLARPMAGQHPDTVPLLILLIGTVWGFFIHANVRWRFGWLEWIISTPNFHHWHHINDEHIDRNYASMLPWMDKIFGTCYMPKEWPVKYGTDSPVPQELVGQLLYPFMPQNPPTVAPAPGIHPIIPTAQAE